MVDYANISHNTFGTYTGVTTERSRSPPKANTSIRGISPENSTNETLDRKFVTMMLDIEKRYQTDEKL